ncbi:MAG: Fe-S cluster assembly sulfur transfer protein SufU [Candidatus Izemoplasmataceae bacterium]|jgi:SUF system NifU family Fe-S assembly protein|uniref:Fe-S cluster assembly sulfur transfer protein SufU n=1 Tax=Liberiplasma polymorphum TaxID=3374570 RepID=UPI003770E911
MEQLENLYRQIIMDHYKNPRNKGLLDNDHYHKYHIKNPSCGDDITIQSRIEDGIVKDVRHEGSGCSICCSSASVLSTLMIGKPVSEAQNLTTNYLRMILNQTFDQTIDLDDAFAYQGVTKFPARVKCATIAWKAFEQTLKEEGE